MFILELIAGLAGGVIGGMGMGGGTLTIPILTIFLSYEQFLSLLIQLAQKQNKNAFNQNPKLILNNFFTALFETFNDINDNPNIDTSFQYKSMKNLISYMPDNEQTTVINEICFTLNEIYII